MVEDKIRVRVKFDPRKTESGFKRATKSYIAKHLQKSSLAKLIAKPVTETPRRF